MERLHIILVLFLLGFSVPTQAEDLMKGLFVFQTKMAEMGDSDAMFALGGMYEDGTGVKPDLMQAKLWYKKAADMGHDDAIRKLKELSNPPKKISGKTLATRNSPIPKQDKPEQDAKRLQELEKELKRKELEAERARAEADEAKRLKLELAKANKKAKDAERLRIQLEKERAIAEEARQETLRVKAEKKLLEERPEPVINTSEDDVVTEVAQSESDAKPAKESTEFKTNPCDSPAAKFMATCR